MNILWDFDGTLAYRDGMWVGTLFSILQKNTINIPLEKIKPYLSKGFTWHTPELSHKEIFKGKTWWEYYESYFENIFVKLKIQKEIAIKLSKQVKTEYKEKAKWCIYDDVIKALEKTIKNGNKNIIASNHIPELNEIVNNLNIGKYFTKIYSSGKIGYEKPNRIFYEYILNDQRTGKENCIIVGDSYESDIRGGENMGIKSILVRTENRNNYELYSKDLEGIIEKYIVNLR